MCFSLAGLESILVWLIIVGAIIAIIRIVVPWILSFIGIPMVGQVLNIVLWAVVAIIAVYIIFDLLSCLLSMGGGIHLPHSR